MTDTNPLYLVDAFSSGPFTGNPAGVCLLERAADAAWMQAVAAELHQAETAFLVRRGAEWDLRWFTPTIEVDLCGHATLAAAAVLWERGLETAAATISFRTRSGVLSAHQHQHGIAIQLPAVSMVPAAPPEGLIDALGIQPLSVFRAGSDYVIEVHDEVDVRFAAPDLVALGAIPCRGVGITTTAHGEADVVSRFFAPASGIPEDAVTGSFHCALGPFWSKRLRKETLLCEQASSRGGRLLVTPTDAVVTLVGQARIVMSGTWHQ